VVGIDMNVALRLSDALGFDTVAVANLLPQAEAGLLEGLNRLNQG
jgi:hypothetical protein